MIDFTVVDRLYEAGLMFAIFDKRVLLPLSQLPDAVVRETGEALSEDDLRAKAGQGWFPLLPGAGSNGTEEGTPLYALSRIGLLQKLQRDGYAAEELELIARLEEWTIDEILTTGDLAYADDDLDALVLYAQARLIAVEGSTKTDAKGHKIDQSDEITAARRELEFLERLRITDGIPEHKRESFAKHVYRVRFVNEFIRLQLLDGDRGMVRAGYSPFVIASRSTIVNGEVTIESISWEMTIRSAIANGEGERAAPIRVPGFLLHGDRVTTTKTVRPAAYANLWKQSNLDKYLEIWAKLNGEHRCLNCSVALASDDERKKFCSEKCRNAARQRRHRERNPEAVARAQQRYWQSLDS